MLRMEKTPETIYGTNINIYIYIKIGQQILLISVLKEVESFVLHNEADIPSSLPLKPYGSLF